MRYPLLGVLLAMALSTGCDRDPADAAPAPTPTKPPPASAAGGVCELLDYAVIRDHLGVEFDVAASGAQGDTLTCAVQRGDASYPDLVLSVTPTLIEPKIFTSTITPKGSQAVPGLGRTAYASRIAPAGDAGPGLEVGWLGAKRVVLLRYKLPRDADPAGLTETVPKLVALAKRVETPPPPPPSPAPSKS